ncbi:MAG: sporulation protein YabP [Agathobacter sp.]|nr:sporulation protein YabP [Agathobacter sp.]
MEENKLTKSHKIVLTNRKNGSFTGVLDVISFDISEILLETEQGMLNVKGKDLHVNRLNLEKGEVDVEGIIDSLSYSQVPVSVKKPDNLLGKWFK